MTKLDFFLKKIREQAAKRKNDAKLRYHQGGRPTNRHKSAHASSSVIESKKYKQVNIKVEIHVRRSNKAYMRLRKKALKQSKKLNII